MNLFRKLVIPVVAVAGFSVPLAVDTVAPIKAEAASGYLYNCVIYRYTYSASSVCSSADNNFNYNGLQRIEIVCTNGAAYLTRVGAYVLKNYVSTATCPAGYWRLGGGYEYIRRL